MWGPVVQWLVQRFRSERLRVRSRRSATFTPSAHVRRQSLPVWPPTLNNYLYLLPFCSSVKILDFRTLLSMASIVLRPDNLMLMKENHIHVQFVNFKKIERNLTSLSERHLGFFGDDRQPEKAEVFFVTK